MFLKRIKKIIKWLTPFGIIHRREELKQKIFVYNNIIKEDEIRNYFLSLNTNDPEILEIIEYFKKHNFSVFPYEFTKKYHASDINVFYDNTAKMQYVIHNNKRLYFPEDWDTIKISAYYNEICIEQDKDSPHCYEADGYVVQDGDVIADVGTAEGIWALSYAEKAEKIYLFECKKKWIKSLEKTFEPWKEKVVFVNKYVSNKNNNKNITLDSFFNKKRIDFIKADIEGMEIKLLEGSKNILSNNNKLKLLLCTYHSKNDITEIKKVLEMNGFNIEYSKRYMLFTEDIYLEKPYIRRGLIRAKKNV